MKRIKLCFMLSALLIASTLADGHAGDNASSAWLTCDFEECSPLYTFTGEAADDAFGWSVQGAGDVDGDGYDDVIVGAPRSDAAGSQSGRAYVYSGLTGSLLYQFTGEHAGDQFGGAARSLGVTGDVNGDGHLDFICGARFNGAAGVNAGRVYIFLGCDGPFPIVRDAADADMIVSGEAQGDRLGYSVSIAGDLNDDGYDDLLLGATQDYSGGSAVGKAYVFLGSAGPYPMSVSAASADLIILGEGGGHLFSMSVSGLGDINSDGLDDFIVGAPSDGTTSFNGRSYVFLGDKSDFPAVVPAGSADMIIDGEAGGDHFGASVTSVGDLNEDGFDDIFVGATYNNSGGTDAGRAYVFLGGDAYPVTTNASAADIIITGGSAYEWLGCSLSSAGDVNCDGHTDLLIGAAPWDFASPGSTGKVYLFLDVQGPYPRYLSTSDADLTLMGEVAGDLFGTVAAGAGDVNGNGTDDLIIGAPKNDSGGADAGRAYVYDCFDCEPQIFPVAFDIMPGSCPNVLNVKPYRDTGIESGRDAVGDILAKISPSQSDRGAVFPVAIVGTADFDVTDIDVTTVLLEGVSPLRHSLEDVATPVGSDAEECECNDDGPDGFDDLTLKFDRYEIVRALGEVYDGDIVPLTISGIHLDGTPFEGIDCVLIRGKDELPPLTSTFGLSNYPNPFNPSTRIQFTLSDDAPVRLDIFNITGQTVATLVNQYLPSGTHEVVWNASSVASGVYFYRLSADGISETKRMLLLK